jgi:nucleotide-binding universal stress UspA family protein
MAARRKVLLAYDGSAGAVGALADLMRNRSGLPEPVEVLVLCVADVWTAERLGEVQTYAWGGMPFTPAQLRSLETAEQAALVAARKTAAQACARLKAACPAWDVRGESAASAPVWGIVQRAGEWGADLIVMGTHGRSAIGRAVLGSVSQGVVREASCGVRVVRGRAGARGAPASLIIGYDGSPDATAAVEEVAARSWLPGSAVRVVTAVDGGASTPISLCLRDGREGGVPAWTRHMMEAPVRRLRKAGLSVTPVVRRGDPRRVLAAESRRWKADTLFVGASGLRGFKRFLLGSVSSELANRAGCPVEIVRQAGRKTEVRSGAYCAVVAS